jgi:DNA-binding Lrp family transcriptional regulator
LLKDGRKEFTKIAREADVSKDVIWQHYKKMKKKRIIVGATVQLHYASLGYNAVANFFVKFEPEKQDQVLRSVKKIPRIFSAGSMNDNSEIWVVATMKDIEEMEQIKQKIKKLPFVLGLTTIVWMGLRSIIENLSVLSTNETLRETNATEQKGNSIAKTTGKIDETDRQIIDKLAVNGRVSFRKIANELKISTDTVTRRYRNLKQRGTIKTVLQINPVKLGYTAEAFIDLSYVPQHSAPNIVETLAKIPDIIKIIKTSGVFDLRLFTLIKNLEHLFTIQNKIAAITGVTKIKIVIQETPHILPFSRENTSTF